MTPTQVLLVEDDADDAELTRRQFASGGMSVTIHRAVDANQAHELIGRACNGGDIPGLDLALVDLNLPGSDGMVLVDAIGQRMPRLPIIVLTALRDEQMAIGAVQRGAEDYLVKGTVEPGLLVRAARYAIERRRVHVALLAQRQENQRISAELERLRLTRLTEAPLAGTTAGSLGAGSLKQAPAGLFDRLVSSYFDAVCQALQDQALDRDADPTRQLLGQLAQELGLLRAGPRDVVELHLAAMGCAEEGCTDEQRISAIRREGRLVLIELLCQLVGYYRHAWPFIGDGSDAAGRQVGA